MKEKLETATVRRPLIVMKNRKSFKFFADAVSRSGKGAFFADIDMNWQDRWVRGISEARLIEKVTLYQLAVIYIHMLTLKSH